MSRAEPLEDPAHAHLVAAWVRGWALSRELAPPTASGPGWSVEVGLPQQRARHVFPWPCDALRRLGETIGEPAVFLKACVPPAALRACLPARWILQPDGFMMTCCDAPFVVVRPLPAGYVLQVEAGPRLVHARIRAPDGGPAAEGHLALDATCAIYDRIGTEPAHQRLGLASHVLRALQRAAHAHDRRAGILVATPAGRALYAALGWRQHAPFATAVIPSEPPAA